ncbi:hypothetical protein QC760_009810 [Botrytis cinerea]
MEWRNSVLDSHNTFTGNDMRWGVNELKVGRISDDQLQGQVGITFTKKFETFNHYGTVFYSNTYEEETMAACLTLIELSQPNKEEYLNGSTENDRDLILSTEQELDACFTLMGLKRERCFFASNGIAVPYRRERKLRGLQRGFFNHTCEQHSKCSTQAKDTVISNTRDRVFHIDKETKIDQGTVAVTQGDTLSNEIPLQTTSRVFHAMLLNYRSVPFDITKIEDGFEKSVESLARGGL